MEHGIRLYTGKAISLKTWTKFVEALENKATATGKELAKVRSDRDFDVSFSDGQRWKQAQGSFKKAVHGIKSVVRLSEDLVVCTPHVDITSDVELDSGRKLQQVYTSYPERDSRAANPRRYDRPFYLRFFPSGSPGEILVLTPSGLPEAMQYALDTEILPSFEAGCRKTEVAFPDDPFIFLDAVWKLKRLDHVQSATVVAFRTKGEAPTELREAFPRDAGSLQEFRKWYSARKKEFEVVTLESVRFSCTLGDVGGTSFEVILRPKSKSPIGLGVAQSSASRAEAYRLLTDVLHGILSHEENAS